MSHKLGETSCYMDGIRVKISEKYKPPPKITLAMTYAQRLTLNRQLQDNLQSYNFDTSFCVKEKMKEWRMARCNIATQQKIKLEKLAIEEKLKKKKELESVQVNAVNADSNKITGGKESEEGLLIPTQSNILTPIPLAPQKYVQTIDDASPINISDFEPDTSSPFDNLELKSINDLEELKIVLQNEDKSKYQHKLDKNNHYPIPNNQICEPSHNSYCNLSVSLPSTIPNQAHHQYSTVSAATSTMDTNGYAPYYGNSSDLYTFYKSSDHNSLNNFTRNVNNADSGCATDKELSQAYNMVPDILKALQNQLNLNIQQEQSVNVDANLMAAGGQMQHSKIKSIDNHFSMEDDKLENPYHNLSKSTQSICDSIATMGFPVARVARVCKLVGDDEKKIVEYLLCQSQLMDLGFSEEKVTSALNESDNNRDKALELLIS